MEDFVTIIGEPPPRRAVIIARLEEIDAITTKPRTIRELSLNNAGTIAWVTVLDNEATALRGELATL